MKRTFTRLAVAAAIAAGSLTGLAALGSTTAGADPTSVLYNSTVSPLPGNLVSQAFEATQTSELGDAVHLTSTAEPLNNVVVTMSTWTCGNWANQIGDACTTTPGTSYSQPLTFNFYALGTNGAVGPVLATVTHTFNIPFRPSGNPACPDEDGTREWMDPTGACHGGMATNVTFDFSSLDVTLPSDVIYSIAFNTGGYGPHPLGDPTPDDSLNVGLTADPTNISAGYSEYPGKLYMNTTTASDYCDAGTAGTGTFRLDSPNTDPNACPSTGGGWTINDIYGVGSAPYYVPAVQINADVAPTVVNLNPAAGPTAGGNTVTITGNNLLNTTSVTFGTTPATVLTDTLTQLTVKAPAGTGTKAVTVSTFGGSTSAGNYTYVSAPAVTAVTPNSGPLVGGNTVVITGSNLAGATAVDFASTPAVITADPASGSSVTVLVPAGVLIVDVTVTTPGGTSATSAADKYTYVSAPVVSSISPTSGPAAGGTTVGIVGTSFANASAVTFGGTAAASFTVNSSTSITAKSPAGVGTVDVIVSAPGGTSSANSGDKFTYVPAPTTLTTTPAVLSIGIFGISLLTGPNAILTTGGHAFAGQTLNFTAPSGAAICSAVTNAAGFASCGTLSAVVALLNLGFVAHYAGNGSYAASAAAGSLIEIL